MLSIRNLQLFPFALVIIKNVFSASFLVLDMYESFVVSSLVFILTILCLYVTVIGSTAW